jgi:hypothetical protein
MMYKKGEGDDTVSGRSYDLSAIGKRVSRGETIEDVLTEADWKGFEDAVGQVFAENGFYVRKNVRIKTGRRYEIDVVASCKDCVFCVDCKRWGRGREKKSAILKAARTQAERTAQLESFLRGNPIASKIMHIKECCAFKAMVVTLNEEAIDASDCILQKAFILPMNKLNFFLCQGCY